MNVKAGSVLEHRSFYTYPGFIVLTLEDTPGKNKRTWIVVLASDVPTLPPGYMTDWKLTPEDWRKL